MKRFLITLMILFFGCEMVWSEEQKNPTAILWQLTNQTHTQMMSYLIKTNDGQLIVIDGGNNGDAAYLLKMIRGLRPDGHVELWILTHPHSDHYGALSELLQKNSDRFSIKTLSYAFPDLATINRLEPGDIDYCNKNLTVFSNKDMLKNVGEVRTPHKNERYKVGPVTMTAMNDMCTSYDQYTHGLNDSTIAWRLDTGKTSVLFLGDMGVCGGDWLLASQKPEMLQCDYTQLAHHGQSGMSEKQYQVIRPRRCLWPTTDWIWNNDLGKGPGTGPLTTEQTKSWMKKLGVTDHYNAKDGTMKIALP